MGALQSKEQGTSHPPSTTDVVDQDHLRPPMMSTGAVPSLPDDPLVEILSRVPAKSLGRFKCVSKPWCGLITDRLRCRSSPQTLEGFFYGDDEGLTNCGHFVNLSGASSPLVDPSFSFLKKKLSAGIEEMIFLSSSNGLLLFGRRRRPDPYDSLGYIVCNPTTEQWVAVPSSGWTPSPFLYDDGSGEGLKLYWEVVTHLIFSPAISQHFQLVQLFSSNLDNLAGVHTYSSETGVWRLNVGGNEWERWAEFPLIIEDMACLFNGFLHLMVSNFFDIASHKAIFAFDGEGKISRIIRCQKEHGSLVGQSQGRLHCISYRNTNDIYVWVLEDYDSEKWVLKHIVSTLQQFGGMICHVVAIHPDRNLLFFVQPWNRKLISYDMDSKEVCALCTVGDHYRSITPYVPYFAQSSVLAKKH